jgi:transposase InsO family protein
MTPLTDAQKIDGSKSKSTINSLLDAFSRKCMAIGVQHKLNSTDVVGAITDLFTLRGVPASIHLRLHNGLGFVALRFQDWLKRVGISHCRSIHAAHGEWI